MDLTESLVTLVGETAQALKGHARRVFLARTVAELGRGGQRRAEREWGWSHMTIRTGQQELRSGIACAEPILCLIDTSCAGRG